VLRLDDPHAHGGDAVGEQIVGDLTGGGQVTQRHGQRDVAAGDRGGAGAASACNTSQSIVIVRSPSRDRSVTLRSDRPISRWISCVRHRDVRG
jgi:hypothetical protein